MKLFGFSKKEKITINKLATIYSNTLFEVIDNGFPEIIEFVNDNRKFEDSPNLQRKDVSWFLMIIFVANNYRLSDFLDETVVVQLHHASLNEIISFLDEEEDVIRDMFLDYEQFFKEQFAIEENIEKSMAKSIFIKYNLNQYQGKLLKNQNEANPVFLQELTDLLSHFIWNWDDYLLKYKIVD